MVSNVEKFIDEMAKHGIIPASLSDIKATDKWTNFKLADDDGKKKRGYYRLRDDGDFAVGSFGDRRVGDTISWFTKDNDNQFDDEARAAWEQKVAESKKKREREKLDGWLKTAKKAKETWDKAKDADPEHPYLVKKKARPNGLRQLDDELLLPMYYDNKLWGMQRILPDGTKLYMANQRKQGCMYPIGGSVEGKFIIAEGYATGDAVNQATDIPTAICYDASNILPVARILRNKYPDAKIIIAADNDQWTFDQKKKPDGIKREEVDGDDPRWQQWAEEGRLQNPGLNKAKQAAAKVGGYCVLPNFEPNDAHKNTDFNDLFLAEGAQAVKDLFDAVGGEKVPHLVQTSDSEPVQFDQPPLSAYEDIVSGDYSIIDDTDSEDDDKLGDLGLPLRVLGFNKGDYYYYPFGTQQIMSIKSSGHTVSNLISMADYNYWELLVDPSGTNNPSPTKIQAYAGNALMRLAEAKGVFKEGDKVRGCGVWTDAGRVVVHCGSHLYVDNVKILPRQMESGGYVYEASAKLLDIDEENPLTNKEAYMLRKICEGLCWENDLSGLLLAGWIVIAQVCASLDWRPHIWITGEAGAGKSTVIDRIVRPALGSIAFNVDGGSTESGIRDSMGADVRPIVFDEAEGKGDRVTNMDGVLGLARLASHGGTVNKYKQRFAARSAFCFSAINPPIKEFADITRISMMNLKKNRHPNAREQYSQLLDMIDNTITPDFPKRLLARTAANLKTLLKNIDTFQDAASAVIKGAREAQQISAMLAGLFMLSSTKEVSLEEAKEWIAAKDWTEHTSISHTSGPERLLHFLATSIVTVKAGGGAIDTSIGRLVDIVVNNKNDGDVCNARIADRKLREYSIAVRPDLGGIVFGNENQNMRKLLSSTDWALGWGKALNLLEGAQKKGAFYFASGDKQNGVMIPIDTFFGTDQEEEEEIAIE